MGYIILIISWFLRTYGAVQERRNPLDTPLALQGEAIKTLLMLVWVLLLAGGSYLVFSSAGLIPLAIILALYFFVAPMFLGKLFKKMMDKFGF